MAVLKFHHDGAEVNVTGINAASKAIVDRVESMTGLVQPTGTRRIEKEDMINATLALIDGSELSHPVVERARAAMRNNAAVRLLHVPTPKSLRRWTCQARWA